jgi:putative nucleotidyltransferase with HDIG domain
VSGPGAEPGTTHVLYVSDPASTPEALRRAMPATLHVTLAADSDAALSACEERAFDAVFVDFRAAGIGALALLAHLMEAQPRALRVAIAEPDDDDAVRAAGIAHRLLTKPFDADAIEVVVKHASVLRTRMQDDRIRLLIGGVGTLPSVPRLYASLTRLLREPHVSIDAVTQLVAEDVGVTAKILHLANSALFGISRQVRTLRSAVVLLGTETIRSLVLATEVMRAFAAADPSAARRLEQLQAHSLSVAWLAARLLPGRLNSDEVFAAALLHDVGKLILLDRCPDLFAYLDRTAGQRGAPIHRVELEVLGVTHAEIGAYLLHLWNLPDSVIAAVASHHNLARPSATQLALAVHTADALVHGASPATRHAEDARLDLGGLHRFGVADRLPAWQAMAAARLRGLT